MEETKLNLGSGNLNIPGYISVDSSPLVKPDILIDLNDRHCLNMFHDNSVDEILCYHVLEHINNFIPLMKEIHRVCKPGAKIYVKCPFFSSWGQYNDPTHCRFFSTHTFDYFNKGNYSHETNTNKDMFDVNVRLNYAIGRMSFMNWLMNPLINLWKDFYVRFFAFIIPCSEIRYALEVIK